MNNQFHQKKSPKGMEEKIIACCKKEIKKRPYHFFTVILTASALAIGFISALLTLGLQSLIAYQLSNYFYKYNLFPLYPELNYFTVNMQSIFLPIFLLMLVVIICFASNLLLTPRKKLINKFPFWRWSLVSATLLYGYVVFILPFNHIVKTNVFLSQFIILGVYLFLVTISKKVSTFLWGREIPKDCHQALSFIPLLNSLACLFISILLPHNTIIGPDEYSALIIFLIILPAIVPAYVKADILSAGEVVFMAALISICILFVSLANIDTNLVQSSHLGGYDTLINTSSPKIQTRLKQLCPEQQHGFACWVVFNAQNKLYLSRDANHPHWESFNKAEVNFHWLKQTSHQRC